MGEVVDLTFKLFLRKIIERNLATQYSQENRQRLHDVAHGIRLVCREILASPDKDPVQVAREMSDEVRDPDTMHPWILPPEGFPEGGA